jgi:hypothetical protein
LFPYNSSTGVRVDLNVQWSDLGITCCDCTVVWSH